MGRRLIATFIALGGCTYGTAQTPARIVTGIEWSERGVWLKADFHTHTQFSDGGHSVEEIVEAASKNGCDVVAITDHADGGLIAHDGALKGFAICGPDKKFVWAIAEIVGKDKIVVSSPSVPNPIAVRYGWANYPVVNLWNEAGLPASPFRTDNF